MFTMTFKTDNSAFDNDSGAETARILREVARKIEAGSGEWSGDDLVIPCFDFNGNTVGWAELSDDGDEE